MDVLTKAEEKYHQEQAQCSRNTEVWDLEHAHSLGHWQDRTTSEGNEALPVVHGGCPSCD